LLIAAASGARQLEELVRRRAGGEPLECILGWAQLCGLRFAVRSGVFVPRRRSEFLVRQAVVHGRRVVEAGRRPVVVDLCCGCGALGIAVAAQLSEGSGSLGGLPDERPGVELHLADLDPVAAQCAQENVTAHLAGRAGMTTRVHVGDLDAALPASARGRVDLLLANAPYVPSGEIGLLPPEAREHEPLTALDGGTDGLSVLRRVLTAAPRWLGPGGHVLVETARRQAAALVAEAARVSGGRLAARAVHSAEDDATVLIALWRGGDLPAPGGS
jgi:release factor glutamine methyltransferase